MVKRLDKELWEPIRAKVWERDKGRCTHCGEPVLLSEAHIDHIRPLSKGGKNHISNLRTLCRRCHVLRSCRSHQGMIASALRDEVIPPDWHGLVWDDPL